MESSGTEVSAMLSHHWSMTAALTLFFCIFYVLCFTKHLKWYRKNYNQCILLSLFFPWYCKKMTFKEEYNLPATACTEFYYVTNRNLSRNKLLPFSCTKETFMRNLCSEECDIVFIFLKWTWWFMGNMLMYSESGL